MEKNQKNEEIKISWENVFIGIRDNSPKVKRKVHIYTCPGTISMFGKLWWHRASIVISKVLFYHLLAYRSSNCRQRALDRMITYLTRHIDITRVLRVPHVAGRVGTVQVTRPSIACGIVNRANPPASSRLRLIPFLFTHSHRILISFSISSICLAPSFPIYFALEQNTCHTEQWEKSIYISMGIELWLFFYRHLAIYSFFSFILRNNY